MIRFHEFTKRYGDQVAVDRLSLEIGRGEIVALVGPNGSGKTTTLKAAAGLIRPSSGGVLVGDPPSDPSTAAARNAVSFMPQRVSFPEALTGAEIVSFYCGLRGTPRERGAAVLRLASLNGASGRPVGTYSGGMIQRLGLAVAMIPHSTLLLDEPAAALDPLGVAALYEAVHERRRAGTAVLFSTHRIGDVEALADRLAIVVRGKLLATMTHRELRDRLRSGGTMRLTIPGQKNSALAVARVHFPAARVAGDELIVDAAPADRASLLEALRSNGVVVGEITTADRSLDDLYRELVGQVGDDDSDPA